MAVSSGTGQVGNQNAYNAAGSVTYNYAQLEGIWIQAGGPAGAAPIAAAIAMAESGGTTTATNQDSNGTVDRGLWQINSVHGDTQSTYDVMGNARAAVAISNKGTNWSAWVTYNNGKYLTFVQANVPPDTNAPINATNAAANQNATLTGAPSPACAFLPSPFDLGCDLFNIAGGSASGIIGGAGGAVGSAIAEPIVNYIIKVVLGPLIRIVAGVLGIAAGGTMVLVGLFIMARNTQTGQAAERTAGTAAQTGMMVAAPETSAVTQYSRTGAEGETIAGPTVTRTSRQSGSFSIGGRPIQYRPARVRTSVQEPPPTDEQLRTEAEGYRDRNGSRA